MNTRAKVYKNKSGEQSVTIYEDKELGLFLANFSGFEHSNNNSTLCYEAIRNDLGTGYNLRLLGTNKVQFRNDRLYDYFGGQHDFYLVTLGSDIAVPVEFAEVANEQKIVDMKAQYAQRQGLFGSRIDAKKQIAHFCEKLIALTEQSIEVNIDWEQFENKKQRNTPGMLSTIVNTLLDLCEEDKDYFDVIKTIVVIVLLPADGADQHLITLNDGQLTIIIDENAPNVTETSYIKLLDIINSEVLEIKAVRMTEQQINEQVAKTQVDCGNAELTVKVDWKKFASMINENEEKLKESSYQAHWVLTHAATRTVSVLETLSKLAQSDSAYKEELAQLTDIIVHPKIDFTDADSEFLLEATTLTVLSGHKMTRDSNDFMPAIKSLY